MIYIDQKVGFCSDDDNIFKGLSVNREIVGHKRFTETTAMASGGPQLSEEDVRYLDQIMTCMNNVEPNVWPLKLTWLGAFRGRSLAGLASALASFHGGIIGPGVAPSCIRFWQDIWKVHQHKDWAAVEEVLAERLTTKRVSGFGVVARTLDERVAAIDATVVAFDKTERVKVQFMQRVREFYAERQLQINAGGAFTGALFDLGYDETSIELQLVTALWVPMMANAFEAASLQPEALANLPAEAMVYSGAGPRRSPRAKADND